MQYARFKHWILVVLCLLCAGAARAQSITLISGNGQLLDTLQHTQSQPLVVLVRDASGNPIKGATVSWTNAPVGRGALSSAQSTTDATGQTQILFTASASSVGSNSFVQSTVTASGGGGSVQFTLTTVENSGVSVYDHITLLSPPTTVRSVSGKAGLQGTVPVSVNVSGALGGTQQGQGIPNVSVTVVQSDPKDASTIACAGGPIIYTAANGNAVCNLVFGGKIGTGNFTIVIGATSDYPGYTYNVEAGPPAAFVGLSGNNQTGNPGQTLPLLLGATLTDLGGNPVPNAPVTFSTVGAVTLSRVSTSSDANGNVAAIATLGNGAGPVQVTVSAGNGVSATFNLTINVIITGLNQVSGNGQAALVNTAFSAPLIVQVVDGGAPVPGVNVGFAVTSGTATLGTSSVTTDGSGIASTTVTAGATPGPVSITASASGTNTTTPYTQTFNLSITPPGPVCNLNNTFENGASFAPNQISPGGVAVIYCTSGIADSVQGVVSADPYGFGPYVLPLEVQHVTVKFGDPSTGIYAPIFYVANINGQQSIGLQVPFELYPFTGTTIPVTINSNNLTLTLTAPLQQGAPGIFEYTLADGVTKNAILLHADGTLVTPNKPALGGETLSAYVTGLIPPFNASGDSVVSSNSFGPSTPVTVTTPVLVAINGAGLAPPTTTYAQGMIGVWEVQFVVPTSTPGSAATRLAIGIPINGKTVVAKGSKFPVGPLPK